MELLFLFAIPLLASFFSLLTKKRAVAERLSLLASGLIFLVSLFLTIRVSASGTLTPNTFLSVDALGALALLTIATVAFASTAYSIFCLREETLKKIIGPTRVKQYFILSNLSFLAAFFVVVSQNPIFTWIALEATTLSTCFLISFYNKPSTVEAAWKYLIINSVGMLLGFFGTLLFFTALGTSESTHLATWNDLVLHAKNLDPNLVKIAFVFVCIGYGTKVGLVPLHTWKPDAYSKSPAPVGALLSGIILPIALVVLLKFRTITNLAIGPSFTESIFLFFGTLSVAFAAFILLTTRNYKRMLAYSSIEHAGLIILGFAFGGAAIFAALFHLVLHSLTKAAAFFLAGNLLLRFSSARILSVSGALTTIPATAILLLLVLFSASGMPPFGTFFTELSLLSTGMTMHPLITIFTLLCMVILFFGFLRHLVSMLFGKTLPDVSQKKENIFLLLPSIGLLLLVVFFGLYLPPFLLQLLTAATEQYRF